MKLHIILLCIVTYIVSISVQFISEPSTLEETIEHYMDKYNIPGLAISTYDEHGETYKSTFGYSNKEEKTPFTSQTLFRVESISKSVTSLGVLNLLSNDSIQIDQEVSSIIDVDGLKPSTTVRELLTHTSGLKLTSFGNHFDPNEDIPTNKETIENDIQYRSSSSFHYTNVGYNILELLVEVVSNQDFNSYMQENILFPLEMNHTSFNYETNQKDLYALGYDLNNEPVDPYIYPDRASGGMISNIDDMSKLIESYITPNPIVSTDIKDQLYSIKTNTTGVYSLISDGYSYGHFIDQDFVFHGGQGHGWMSFFVINKAENKAIFIVANSQNSYPLFSKIIGDWAGNETPIRFSLISKLRPPLNSLIHTTLFFILISSFLTIKNSKNPVPKNHMKYCIALLIFIIPITITLFSIEYMFIKVLYPNIYKQFLILLLTIIGYIIIKMITIFRFSKITNNI